MHLPNACQLQLPYRFRLESVSFLQWEGDVCTAWGQFLFCSGREMFVTDWSQVLVCSGREVFAENRFAIFAAAAAVQ
ncbi:hypothetical protein LJC08_01800 [Methanimicrococcus sp. OttesenSCG-928-J09]|nr:hypothetical protein [Methanimicrococcus sp. OttesenSCG-928-J09]